MTEIEVLPYADSQGGEAWPICAVGLRLKAYKEKGLAVDLDAMATDAWGPSKLVSC